MNKMIKFGIAALTLALVAVLPVASVIWLAAQLNIGLPGWLIYLLSFGAALVSFEAANRVGPKPFTTPLAKLRQRYPTRRDKFVLLGAAIISILIATYRPSRSFETSWLIPYALTILGLITGVVICIVFGSSVLRNDLTPSVVKRLSKW